MGKSLGFPFPKVSTMAHVVAKWDAWNGTVGYQQENYIKATDIMVYNDNVERYR